MPRRNRHVPKAPWLVVRVIQHAPEWSTGWVIKAMVADRLGQTEAASVAVDQALQLDEQNLDAWALKSALLRSSEQLDEAKQLWARVEAILSQTGATNASVPHFLTPWNLATRLGKFPEAAVLNQRQLGLSGRDGETPKEMIDLTPFYTRGLDSHEVEQQAELLQNGLDGVRFDARGHAQISSEYTASSLPSQLNGTPIDQSFRQLHLVMSVSGDDLSGVDAVLRLNYADGSTQEMRLEIASSSEAGSGQVAVDPRTRF